MDRSDNFSADLPYARQPARNVELSGNVRAQKTLYEVRTHDAIDDLDLVIQVGPLDESSPYIRGNLSQLSVATTCSQRHDQLTSHYRAEWHWGWAGLKSAIDFSFSGFISLAHDQIFWPDTVAHPHQLRGRQGFHPWPDWRLPRQG